MPAAGAGGVTDLAPGLQGHFIPPGTRPEFPEVGGQNIRKPQRLQIIYEKSKRSTGSGKLATDLPSSGTVLIREYQGVRHEVRIINCGFEYAVKSWKSLSKVAREITGVNWNGPKFFGLRTLRGKQEKKTTP